MLFDGPSKRHALGMITNMEAYYQENKQQIHRTVFNDSYYSYRFIPVFNENIRRTHSTLDYILRKQYRNANTVFNFIFSKTYATLQDFVSTIERYDDMQEYIQDVEQFIIHPMLKRHGMYSPNFSFLAFLNMFLLMGSTYSTLRQESEALQNLAKETTNLKIYIDINHQDEMRNDEIQIWRNLHSRHTSSFKK